MPGLSALRRYCKKVNNKIKEQFKLEHNKHMDTVSISPRSLMKFVKEMGQPEKDEVMAKIIVDGTAGQKHVHLLLLTGRGLRCHLWHLRPILQ
eukprot:m51a1_g10233 hypothetical protein (93) ;mRNA; r:2809-4498